MGRQIIKQPNGLYAVFSTETDTIVWWDATAEELVEAFAEQAAARSRDGTRTLIEQVDAGGSGSRRTYAQFTLSWEDAVEKDREHGGDYSRSADEEQAGTDTP